MNCKRCNTSIHAATLPGSLGYCIACLVWIVVEYEALQEQPIPYELETEKEPA